MAWRLDYRQRLAEVRAPTLVTAGRFDPQMPPACAIELADRVRSARLAMFERSGHYPFVEEPEEFWATVSGFLRRHEYLEPGELERANIGTGELAERLAPVSSPDNARTHAPLAERTPHP